MLAAPLAVLAALRGTDGHASDGNSNSPDFEFGVKLISSPQCLGILAFVEQVARPEFGRLFNLPAASGDFGN